MRILPGASTDSELLRDLPVEVDPCGENGEFHSFVYAAPIFVSESRCALAKSSRAMAGITRTSSPQENLNRHALEYRCGRC